MAKLIYESELNVSIEKLIKEAEEQVLLFITTFHLPERIKDCLKQRKDDHTLRLVIVFGDNLIELSKFLLSEDFSFLKSFSNISISYEPRLNANYYASESFGVLTSMNMQTFGDSKFIDVGIVFKTKNILKNITNQTLGSLTSFISDTEDIATESAEFFHKIFSHSTRLFVKEPQYESALFGLQKKYKTSSIITDETATFISKPKVETYKTLPIETDTIVSNKKNYSKPETGFCIRTGVSIPFDANRPLSRDAYRSWAQFGNPNYGERFCHKCGKKTITSVNAPLCIDCHSF